MRCLLFRGVYWVVVVHFAIPLLTATPSHGALTDADRKLLDALLLQRQASLSRVAEGAGHGTLKDEHRVDLNGSAKSTYGPATVEFSFSGPDSIYRMADDQGAVIESALRANGKWATYDSGGHGRGERGMVVGKSEAQQDYLHNERMAGWSLEDFARLPFNADNLPEAQVFKLLIDEPTARLSRHGDLVTVDFRKVLAGSDGHSKLYSVSMEFDLRNAGMLTSYTESRRSESAGTLLERVESTKWKLVDGSPVPAKREVHTRQVRNGKTEESGDLTLTVDDFSFTPGARDRLRIDKLGVPAGTMINDRISGSVYRYRVNNSGTAAGGAVNGEDPFAVLNALAATPIDANLAAAPEHTSRPLSWLWGIPLAIATIGLGVFAVLRHARRRPQS